jgi:glycosyltransferase involved in cell wall biosynthesis
MKVLAMPRDPNPYQELLHGRLRTRGVDVRYLEGPTRSHTVNLALGPLVLAWWRLRGYRLVHLHWVYGFSLPWARTPRWAPRCMQRWFGVWLWAGSILGLRLVWTAHNVLPHDPVFADDRAGRRRLVDHCDAVIAHSPETAAELRQYGANNVAVIPQGGYRDLYPQTLERAEARDRLGLRGEDFVVAFVGSVHPYKGVDLLIDAMAMLPPEPPTRLVVAGGCSDGDYRSSLEAAARRAGNRIRLSLERVPDDELQVYLRAADVAAFPFRSVTNSGSVLLALGFGVPVVIPDLPQLAGVPAAVATRYSGGVSALAHTLRQLSTAAEADRRDQAAAAMAFASARSWDDVAEATLAVYAQALAGVSRSPSTLQETPVA